MRRINLFSILGTLSLIIGMVALAYFVLIPIASGGGSPSPADATLTPSPMPQATDTPEPPIIATPTPEPTPMPDGVLLEIHNQSSVAICEVNVSDPAESYWGANLLEPEPRIEAGASAFVHAPRVGLSDMRVRACDDRIVEKFSENLYSSVYQWTITDEMLDRGQ